MADVNKTIEIIFGAVDQTGAGISSVNDKISDFSTSLQGATDPLANITDSILKLDLVLAGLGAAFIGFAFKESADFESSLGDLKKVLSETEGEVQQYIPAIEDLADVYGVADTNVITAAANFRESGFVIEEALELTDTALKAVKVSELDADQASKVLIATLKGFGVGADEATRLLDVLNEVTSKTGGTVGELAAGMAELSPIADSAGLGFEEMAGLLNPLIAIFGSGAEVATAMKTSLLKLGGDTKPVVEALEAIGISTEDANWQMARSGERLEILAELWPDLTNKQKENIAENIAGLAQALKFTAALNTTEDRLKATAIAYDAAGSASREFESKLGTANIIIDQASVQFDRFLRVVGDQYRVEMAGAIGATGELAAAFNDLVKNGKLEPFFEILRPLLDALADQIRVIAKNLPAAFDLIDFDQLAESAKSLGGAFKGIFEGVDLNTPEGLAEAIDLLFQSGLSLIDVTTGIVEGFTPMLRTIKDAVDAFNDLDPATKESAGNILAIGTSVNIIAGNMDSFVGALNGIGGAITALVGVQGFKALSGSLSGIGTAFTATTGTATTLKGALGQAGLLAAVGVASFELAKATGAAEGFDALMQRIGAIGEGQTLGSAIYDWAEALGVLAGGADDAEKATTELDDATKDANDTYKTVGGRLDALTEEQDKNTESKKKAEELSRQLDEAIKEESANNAAYVESLGDTSNALKETNFAAGEMQSGTFALAADVEKAGISVRQLEDGTLEYIGVGEKFVNNEKEKQDALSDSVKELAEYQLKMEEIASDERIATIEATVELNVAQIQADAEVAVAAFESLGTTIESTGDVISGLFANDAPDWDRFGFEVRDQLEIENALRQRAADDQHDFAVATLEEMRARTQALRDGTSLITIEADGMEPQIEAFMWEILKRIRIRATEEAADFLLGLPA